MAEIRKDPLSDRWVIIAQERSRRPDEYQRAPTRRSAGSCPFCAGHETETPPATAVYPPSSPTAARPWQVRVVPNKYPAVVEQASPSTMPHAAFYSCQPATGLHEVIIESPRHLESLTDVTPEEAGLVFFAYRDCLRRARHDPRLQYGLLFKNNGPLAGASLSHTHSQFVAVSTTPPVIQQELRGAEQFFGEHRQCFFCRIVQDELAHRQRLIATSPHFVALTPFASRFAYETWILPKNHEASYEECEAAHFQELSQFVCDILRGLEKRLDRPDYNYWLHTCPFDTRSYDHYHWHIEIIPRIAMLAGFEWGTGCFINPVSPEDAARSLRETVTLARRATLN